MLAALPCCRARSASHRHTTPAGRDANAEQRARVRQSRNRRSHWSLHGGLAARCNDTLYKSGIDLNTVRYTAAHVGTLYDASCDLCGAQLFNAEVMASSRKSKKRGRSCFSDAPTVSQVHLPDVRKQAAAARASRRLERAARTSARIDREVVDGSGWERLRTTEVAQQTCTVRQ